MSPISNSNRGDGKTIGYAEISVPGRTVIEEDLQRVVDALDPEALVGRTVVVTGATGLLGRLATMALVRLNRVEGCGMRILGLVRNQEKARAMFGQLKPQDGLSLIVHDLKKPLPELGHTDYVLHCAAPSQSRFFVEHPVETIMVIARGTANVLDFALRSGAKSVLFVSSLEVYGSLVGEHVSENDFGLLDPLAIRNSYPEAKRLAECFCTAYFGEHGLPVKIARLTQTFGAGVAYDDERVFAEFARCALNGRDIRLRTTGEMAHSYCYTSDAVAALFTVLLSGENGQAYNIANRNSYCSIRQLAELFAETVGNNIQVVIDADNSIQYPPAHKINLAVAKLESLGWKPYVSLEEMVKRLLDSMRQ